MAPMRILATSWISVTRRCVVRVLELEKLARALFYRAIAFGRKVERAITVRGTFEKCQSRAKNIGMGLRNDSTWPRWYFPEGVMVVALRKHGVGVETIYRRHDHMIDRTGCER